MGTKMGWETFKEKMLRAAMERTGRKAELREVLKNNGRKLCGICFLPDSGNVAPVLYLEGYYQYYQLHDWENTVESFLNVYEANKAETDIDIRFFKEYGEVRKNLGLRLVNYEMNKELLEHVPYRRCLDLAAVPHLLMGDGNSGAASILLNGTYLKMWGVDEEEVFRQAKENMRGSYEICGMHEILKEMGIMETETGLGDAGQLYAATNKAKMYGASVLLFGDILEEFAAEKNAEEVVILPSSVHEVLLLPQTVKTTEEDMESLREMVHTVNREHLMPEEILSNKVYVYDTDKKEINIR